MKKTIRKNKISLVVISFVLPVLAVLLSYEMIKDNISRYDKEIQIYVKEIKGLDIRKSRIKYRGIDIGDIVAMSPDPDDITRFELQVKIYKNFAYLIKQGTIFWKVSANISLDKTENLDTILKGNYIQIQPPSFDIKVLRSLPDQLSFVATEQKPHKEGKTIELKSGKFVPKVGDGIYFQDIAIGEVLQNSLDDGISTTSVLIYKKYVEILTDDCYFYTKNPLDIKLGLDETSIKLSPINSILKGGLHIVKDTTIVGFNPLQIYDSKDILYTKDKSYFEFDIVGDTAKEGEVVYYKGIKIGHIKNQRLKNRSKISLVNIEHRYRYLINKATRFYKLNNIEAKLGLDGLSIKVPSVAQLVSGGISFVSTKTKSNKIKKSYKLYDSLGDIKETYEAYRYFDISLSMVDLQNIKKTSKLYYKNFEIGYIKDISLKDGKIKLDIKVQKRYKNLFGKNSKIYLEGIKVGLDGVKNISSAVLGDKLHLVASIGGYKKTFTIDSTNPVKDRYSSGLRVKLTHKDAKNIFVGTPVFYRYIHIGAVQDVAIYKSGVVFDIFIENRYKKYLKADSIFKRNSSIDMKFSIFDSSIKIGTMRDIFNGGLSIYDGKSTAKARQGHRYKLETRD